MVSSPPLRLQRSCKSFREDLGRHFLLLGRHDRLIVLVLRSMFVAIHSIT